MPVAEVEGQLSHDSFGHVARDVGKPKVATLEPIGQTGVVDATEIKHGRVKIVDVHFLVVLDVAVAKLIGAAPGETAFDATPGDPHREGQDVMVAAGTLAHRSAAEFAAPEHE